MEKTQTKLSENEIDFTLTEIEKKLNFIIWALLGLKSPIGLNTYMALKIATEKCDSFSIEEALEEYGELDFMKRFKDFENIV